MDTVVVHTNCHKDCIQVILVCEFPARQQLRSQKGPTKPKNRANSTKEFSEQFEGDYQLQPNTTRVLRQIAHQIVHPNVQQNLSHTVSLWYLVCPQTYAATITEDIPRVASFWWGASSSPQLCVQSVKGWLPCAKVSST